MDARRRTVATAGGYAARRRSILDAGPTRTSAAVCRVSRGGMIVRMPDGRLAGALAALVLGVAACGGGGRRRDRADLPRTPAASRPRRRPT